MADGWVLVVVFAVIVVLGVLIIIWHFGRSDALLQQWAQRNGYRLLDHRYCWVFKGPFFWTTSKGQTVYRVTVEDEQGRRRSGWVRCGGWFMGLISDKVEARWDD
jgi:hypothetical protein